MADIPHYDKVLLDIEGTTTSISFVFDVLFPYARDHVASFLSENADEPAVSADIDALAAQAKEDREAGYGDAPLIPSSGPERVEAAVANVLWQMDRDRKTTGLKSLQGKIWKHGYAQGTLQGHVFPDVPEAFQRWRSAGVAIYIYSSGSVAAQKLLFGNAIAGDLTPLISGYFDTTTGPKREQESYAAIAHTIGCKPADLLFVTDVLAEAEAARASDVPAVISSRPGNHPIDDHDFPVITSLSALFEGGTK